MTLLAVQMLFNAYLLPFLAALRENARNSATSKMESCLEERDELVWKI